jgi:4-amino-4-deoxy-L-arabinose transferase-like glycosyltransferase
MSRRPLYAAVAALSLVHLGLAATLPPAEDELYYWCWARSLQWSYYDHPPLVAVFVRLSTTLFGDSLLALRLPACLASLATMLIVARLTPAGHAVLFGVLLTPLAVFGSILITPDTPLILFWAAYLAWQVHAHRKLEHGPVGAGTWAVGGLLLGLGLLGKYTMAVAVPASLAGFALVLPWRRWLGGAALHLAIAALGAVPILLFNWQHDFVPLTFQWRHAVAQSHPTAAGAPAFLAGQILLVGLLPFGLAFWAVRRWRELARDPGLRPCLAMFLVPLAFFLVKACRGHMEANWPVVAYLAAWPLAGRWLAERPRPRGTLAAALFAPAVLATAVLAAHLARPFDVVPVEADRLARMGGQLRAAEAVAAVARPLAVPAVYAATYQQTSYLQYVGLPAHQLAGASRMSNFTLAPVPPERFAAALSVSATLPPESFGPPRPVAMLPLVVRGRVIGRVGLFRHDRLRDVER